MERLDPKPGSAHKRSSLVKGILSAVVAGLLTFFIMFLVVNMQAGTAGSIGAGVAIVVGGLVSAITLPTPQREH